MFESVTPALFGTRNYVSIGVTVALLTFVAVAGLGAVKGPASPARLVYSTYIGPTDIGKAQTGSAGVAAFTVDNSGYVYVIWGYSIGSINNRCTSLSKLNQAGTKMIWSTCLPLSEISAMALDNAGYIYVAGGNGGANAVATVLKLSPDGLQTQYATNIPGANSGPLAIDASGSAYLLCTPDSRSFQATQGAYMSTGGNACLTKLNPAGVIQYATYVDLLTVNDGGAITVDSKGQTWAVGRASTTCQPTPCGRSGLTSIAIRKFDATGSHLLVSMNLDPNAIFSDAPLPWASATGVAVDASDAVWVVGTTENQRIPITVNALPSAGPAYTRGGSGGVGFAIKLSSSGGVLYGTHLGNNQPSERDLLVSSVAVDSGGRPHFVLNTPGSGTVYPPNPASLMILSADGSSLLSSTNSLQTVVQFVAIDGNGGLYASGTTLTNAFLTTPGSYLPLYPAPQYWNGEGFVAKFDLTSQAPAGQFSNLLNAASLFTYYYGHGAVAPGEIVTIFGSSLPANPKVTFDDRPAPVLYASPNQINTIVPFEVTQPSAVVSIEGVRSYVLPVWPAVSGLFTASGTGSGQLAAVNQDGTVNSASNPAKAGSVVSVYLTGVGQLSPGLTDGQLGPQEPPYAAPLIGSSATINENPAPILFIGQAPGLIAGCVQMNVQIPAGTPSGDAVLRYYIGDYYPQIGTIAVR